MLPKYFDEYMLDVGFQSRSSAADVGSVGANLGANLAVANTNAILRYPALLATGRAGDRQMHTYTHSCVYTCMTCPIRCMQQSYAMLA